MSDLVSWSDCSYSSLGSAKSIDLMLRRSNMDVGI